LDETPISPGDKSKQAIPLDKQLGHFKKQARRIVERALAGGSDEHLFKPTHVLEANLQCVGIEGKHPAVGFNVYLTEHTQQQVTKALILLGRNMSQDKVDQILNKTCTKPKKLFRSPIKENQDGILGLPPIQAVWTHPIVINLVMQPSLHTLK